MSLIPTIKLSLEMTEALSTIERDGLRVNMDTLDRIEEEYKRELEDVEEELNEMAREAMGDTPISLTSPDHRSMLMYSRVVKGQGPMESPVQPRHGTARCNDEA